MEKFSDFQSLSTKISDDNILFARDYKRGEVYYIGGHSVSTSRPAIIVSNNEINKSMKKVLVVYLTKKQVNPMSTRALILSTGAESYALCEEVCPVSIDAIGGYITTLSAKEMLAVEEAILSAFALQKHNESVEVDCEIIEEKDAIISQKDEEIKRLKATIDTLTIEKDAVDEMYHTLLSAIVV